MVSTACHKPITWEKKQGTEEVQTPPLSNSSTHWLGVRGDKGKGDSTWGLAGHFFAFTVGNSQAKNCRAAHGKEHI